MAKLFANSGDPDQTPHPVASDQGLHCLPITLLWVSRLQWVNDCSKAVLCLYMYISYCNCAIVAFSSFCARGRLSFMIFVSPG